MPSIPIIFPKYEVKKIDDLVSIHQDPSIKNFRIAVWSEVETARKTGYRQNLCERIKSLNRELLEKTDQLETVEKLDNLSSMLDTLDKVNLPLGLLSFFIPSVSGMSLLKEVSLSLSIASLASRALIPLYRSWKYRGTKLHVADLLNMLPESTT